MSLRAPWITSTLKDESLKLQWLQAETSWNSTMISNYKSVQYTSDKLINLAESLTVRQTVTFCLRSRIFKAWHPERELTYSKKSKVAATFGDGAIVTFPN